MPSNLKSLGTTCSFDQVLASYGMLKNSPWDESYPSHNVVRQPPGGCETPCSTFTKFQQKMHKKMHIKKKTPPQIKKRSATTHPYVWIKNPYRKSYLGKKKKDTTAIQFFALMFHRRSLFSPQTRSERISRTRLTRWATMLIRWRFICSRFT